MKVSCLLISHNKPQTVHQAIESVLGQQYQNWHLLVMDSGLLLEAGEFKRYAGERRMLVLRSTETLELKAKVAIAPWCYNYLLDRCPGDVVVYLCDDDLFYPNAFHDFVRFLMANPDILACYGSEDYGLLLGNMKFLKTGERLAMEVCGAGSPHRMDCRVDYLQLCHRIEVLDLMAQPYWPVDPKEAHHSDGLFMEALSRVTPVYPLLAKVGVNRRTRWSCHIPLDQDLIS